MDDALILIGASVRAAAFSALWAGRRPWCADLFADLDLQQRCPCTVIPSSLYPDGFLDILEQAPPGPVVYTGALENAPSLLERLEQRRSVWGNSSQTLLLTRTPESLASLLRGAGFLAPQSVPLTPSPGKGRWLIKPRSSAAGAGVHFWDGKVVSGPRASRCYLQEFIEGESGSALFVGSADSRARLLGVTRQLTGEGWLHAAPFHYCGSIGPWPVPELARGTLEAIGQVLTQEARLRGLFGVDFILRDGVPWVVEVNPRYTASVEVIEHTTGLQALGLHCEVFSGERRDVSPPVEVLAGSSRSALLGKAIWYAPRTLRIPEVGPWMDTLRGLRPVSEPPAFADIPAFGEHIEARRPVLTFFARGDSEAACLEQLRSIAETLDSLFHDL